MYVEAIGGFSGNFIDHGLSSWFLAAISYTNGNNTIQHRDWLEWKSSKLLPLCVKSAKQIGGSILRVFVAKSFCIFHHSMRASCHVIFKSKDCLKNRTVGLLNTVVSAMPAYVLETSTWSNLLRDLAFYKAAYHPSFVNMYSGTDASS